VRAGVNSDVLDLLGVALVLKGIGAGAAYVRNIVSENEPAGAVLQMTALPGKRDELIKVLTHYARTLDGEPGTTLFAAAADPNDDDIVWVWEEFASFDAVREHFEHDFFRALQLELADLLDGPAAMRPLAPFVRRTNPAPSAVDPEA
jgi:quinol monooxygenase YgiN